MNGVTEKFLSFINSKLDSFAKALKVDEAISLQAAQRQIENADIPDFVAAKRTSTIFTADKAGWSYMKAGADASEFVADAVEFMLAIALCYCVRTAEQRVRAIWKTLPMSWQTQPIYDVLYKFKERDDANLRSNIEVAMKNCKASPTGFLEICLKNDSGALNRKRDEAAERAAIEKQIEFDNAEKFKAKIEGEFAELMAEPDYEERFAIATAWYKGKYPKSADFIDSYPQAINGYLINMKLRGGYENFADDDNTSAAETADLDAALLENE